MKKIKLEAVGYFGEEGTEVNETSFDRPVMLVYAGKFDSIDGPVEISPEHIDGLCLNHNAILSKVKRMASGDIPMREYPPLQLDHSRSAAHTIGRLVGNLTVGEADIQGEKKKALFGVVRFLGKENVEKARDGRYTHVSIGADLDPCKINELSVTPFPAAPHAALLANPQEIDYKDFKIFGRPGYFRYESKRSKSVSIDHWDTIEEVKKVIDKKEYKMSRRLASYNGVEYQVEEVETGVYNIYVNGKKVSDHAGSPEEVDKEAQRWIDHEKSEGDTGMHEKLKKHLMEHKKLSEKDAADLAKKMAEHHMKKLGLDEEKMSKHLESADEKEMKRMSDEHDEHEKKLAEGKEDGEKKLTAAKDGMLRLAKEISKSQGEVHTHIRLTAIGARLSQLRAQGKITPAEIKKIDTVKLSAMSSDAMEAALATFDAREPVVQFHAVSGTTKAMAIDAVARKYRLARLEVESRLNMPSKRAEAEKLLAQLSEAEKKDMAQAKGEEGEGEPTKGLLHKVTYEHLEKMLEDAKQHGDLKKHLKHLVDHYHASAVPEEIGPDPMPGDKRMSALAKSYAELQTKFNELITVVAPAIGIKPEDLK